MPRVPALLLLAVCLAVALATAPAVPPATAQQAEPTPAARAFVDRFADDHLSGMLSRIGAQSEALRMLAEFDAQTVATVLDARVAEAVQQHGEPGRATWRWPGRRC